jgi:hypothetical protein
LTTILTSDESFLSTTFADGHYGHSPSGVRVIFLQEETPFENGVEQSAPVSPNADAAENSSRKNQIRFGKGPIPKIRHEPQTGDTSSLDQADGLKQITESVQTLAANPFFNYLWQVRMTLQAQFGATLEFPLNASVSSNIAGLAKYDLRASPGNYFLSIKLPDRNITRFSVSVFPDRMTLLILHRQPNGELNALGFSLAVGIESHPEIVRESKGRIRLMELLQRFYINNRVDETHALQYADKLLKMERIDPFAECLAAYTKLLLNKAGELDEATRRLIGNYQYFSDCHILRTEYLASRGAPAELIINQYYNALSQGIPVFTEGVKRLVQGFEKYGIEHPYKTHLYDVFKNCSQDILWTLWNPLYRAGR